MEKYINILAIWWTANRARIQDHWNFKPWAYFLKPQLPSHHTCDWSQLRERSELHLSLPNMPKESSTQNQSTAHQQPPNTLLEKRLLLSLVSRMTLSQRLPEKG